MQLTTQWVLGSALMLAINFVYAATNTPSLEKVWKLVQQQQVEIQQLQSELLSSQKRLAAAQASFGTQTEAQTQRITQAETAIEATATAVESSIASAGNSGTTIGGYGELHYNNLDNKNEIDLHRFVMFFNHNFNDRFSLYSELEVEHSIAGEGKVGEVEVEQAYVQWDYADSHQAKMGLFLVPVGIINETHEPDTFYGVERNSIEKNVIPATWWEGGLAFSGELAPGWGYDLATHSGLRLDTDNAKASKRSSIRSARQKVGKARADALAYTARLRFNGIAGLQWHTSLQYQADLTQDDADNIGIGEIDGTLLETNLSYQSGNFALRGLYGRWDLNDKIEQLNPGADKQSGWYIEPSYKLLPAWGLFARYSSYDLTAGAGATSNDQNQWDLGFNYWPHEDVVIKFDYQSQNKDKGTEVDGFNLGVGYSF